MRDLDPSNTWFPGPTRVLNPNGISIGSAVFAGLTSVTDRPTDHATRLVTIDRIYVRTYGRCDLINDQLNSTLQPVCAVKILTLLVAVLIFDSAGFSRGEVLKEWGVTTPFNQLGGLEAL